MKKNIAIIIALSLLIWSCEKKIELDESEIKSRIVVNSLFEANDTMRLSLGESRNILFNNGGLLPNILTGKAELFDASGQSIGNFLHEGEGSYYLPNFTPISDEEYELKIENLGFETVTSKSTIPKAVSIIKIDTVRIADYMNISITFKDNSTQENYYSIAIVAKEKGYFESEPGVFETYYYDNGWVCTKDINTFGSADVEGDICSDNSLLIADDNFNGSEYTYTIKKYLDESSDTIIVNLKSVSADLYKYRTTLHTYNEVQGNPFGEPVQVFSNIINGFGIFAGQSVYSDTIFVK